jgi:hypothetical protein
MVKEYRNSSVSLFSGSARDEAQHRRRPMIRFTLAAITAVLTLSFAMPVSAQATVHGPSICRMPIEALDKGLPPTPTAGAILPGYETTTRPWSAPVGHRQPQAADIQVIDVTSSISSIDQALMQENARINRLIHGVCRGC